MSVCSAPWKTIETPHFRVHFPEQFPRRLVFDDHHDVLHGVAKALGFALFLGKGLDHADAGNRIGPPAPGHGPEPAASPRPACAPSRYLSIAIMTEVSPSQACFGAVSDSKIAAIFAGAADALKQVIYNYYGNTNSEGPVIFAAALDAGRRAHRNARRNRRSLDDPVNTSTNRIT